VEALDKISTQILLSDCLKEYTKEELLGEEDTWFCPKCKNHCQIKKKIDIWTLPEVIHNVLTM
jgi:ubiquitin carboxyl-terminal hydrolase 4/11/15